MAILLYTYPADARLKDFTELQDNCGAYCYTENSGASDFVAYCLETYCYDSFDEMEYQNNGWTECESTQAANDPNGCWLNTGNILGMDNIMLTIVCAPKNLQFDNSWEIFFNEQPDYLSGNDLNTWNQYYYDDDVGGACQLGWDTYCEQGEYYSKNEYGCLPCPTNGINGSGTTNQSGFNSITDCYIPSNQDQRDGSGTYSFSQACYYKQ